MFMIRIEFRLGVRVWFILGKEGEGTRKVERLFSGCASINFKLAICPRHPFLGTSHFGNVNPKQLNSKIDLSLFYGCHHHNFSLAWVSILCVTVRAPMSKWTKLRGQNV